MDLDIDIDGWPQDADWPDLAERACEAVEGVAPELANPRLSVSLLFTLDEEVQTLNREWRTKDKPTNVLSFPGGDMPMPGAPVHLGDIVLAFCVCRDEAEAQGKSLANHLTHLVIHGVLHVLGRDHEDEAEAEAMEAEERVLLASLGVADPYILPDDR